jgi:hypothetical protein
MEERISLKTSEAIAMNQDRVANSMLPLFLSIRGNGFFLSTDIYEETDLSVVA